VPGKTQSYDLAVVGAGILGLATALAALRRKLKVVVIDRDAQANGASVRNFGLVTVCGQERGAMLQRARRSREVWCEVAAAAGIRLLQRGLWMCVRRLESLTLLEQFMATEMAEGCRLLSSTEIRRRAPFLGRAPLLAVLESDQELRVESREAIPQLSAWLESRGVVFERGRAVLGIDPPVVSTSRGELRAERVALCPGDDFTTLYAERLARYPLSRCKLQMLRLAAPGFVLPSAIMSDLGLGRYRGFADLAAAGPLKARLAREQPRHLEHGVHLIVVQSADGTLVVGDSHHYATTPDPFGQRLVDELILEEFSATLGLEPPPALERWIGTYAAAADRAVLFDAPAAHVRLATVTTGAGASTAFAVGEELLSDLLGETAAAA